MTNPPASANHDRALRIALPIIVLALVLVVWETVENHTVDFRGSADFQEWRKLVGHCFASPPEVEHVRQVLQGF